MEQSSKVLLVEEDVSGINDGDWQSTDVDLIDRTSLAQLRYVDPRCPG